MIEEEVISKPNLDSPVKVDTSHDLEALLDLPELKINELVSVIVPIASWDKEWRNLLPDLEKLPHGTEIIFSVSEKDSSFYDLPDTVINLADKRIKWVRAKSGRANCLNKGAEAAVGEYLWFLHANMRFDRNCYDKLTRAIKTRPGNLYFSHLKFLSDGPKAMLVNNALSRAQSLLFKTASDAQGLCIKADDFNKIGGFNEHTQGFEGYDLCKKAKSAGLKPVCTGAVIKKSARRYSRQGWLATTLKNQALWFKNI